MPYTVSICSNAGSTAANFLRMRFTCEVTVPSSTTRFASRMRPSRSFTWPGNFASVCTIQNSVSVSATDWFFHDAVKRFASSFRGPRSSTSSTAFGSRSASILRNSAEIRIARGEKKDRQAGRQGAELAAQRKAAVGLLAQADVDHREIGKPRLEGAHRLSARRVRAHLVAVFPERVRVVGADCGVVFDDGDAAGHGQIQVYPLLGKEGIQICAEYSAF